MFMENALFFIAVLLLSVIIHEVAHGYAAWKLGDPTAKNAGRLSLNPLVHLDPIGSFVVPALIFFSTNGAGIFGWAKPVPFNPYNLRNPRSGEAIIAAAGPLSNILVALFFAGLIRAGMLVGLLSSSFVEASIFIIYINILLAFFNMIPIPPLDGSKILFSILPTRYQDIRLVLEQYGFVILLLLIFVLPIFGIGIGFIFNWAIGFSEFLVGGSFF